MNAIQSESSSSDESESIPPPNIPPPTLSDESPYGKVRKLLTTASNYENAPMVPLRKPPPPPTAKKNVDRETIDSVFVESSSLTLEPSLESENSFTRSRDFSRSDSWSFVNSGDNISTITNDSVDSSDEPIYANDENERVNDNNSNNNRFGILRPSKPLNTNENRNTSTLTREILNEFDPLSRESFDAYIIKSMNHITLLETLLSEETYGTVTDSHSLVDAAQIDEDDNLSRSESIAHLDEIKEELPPAPLPPQRTKAPRATSVIIHQNLRLKDDEIENIAQPFLAKVDDQPSTSSIVDLSRPKTSSSKWFIESESSNFVKNNLDNPNNFANASNHEKIGKSIPKLMKVNNIDAPYLPSYEESKNDEIVSPGSDKTPSVAKSRSTIFNFHIMRRNSLKEKKIDPKDFIPHPPFAEESAHYSNDKNTILFKLPSGVIEDMLKELNPRFVEIRKRQFNAFADPEMRILKEHLDLTHLTSVHYLVNHKFSDFKTEGGRQIYCFEINLAIPKNAANGMFDSKGLPVRTQRVSYVYGIHSKQEK